FEHATRCGQRFSKDCMFVGNVFGDGNQVDVWQLEKLGVRAIAAVNSENGARGAMSWISGATERAISATGIYLADDSFTDEVLVGARFNNADKLMPDRSIESRIATGDFEVGVADAG